MTSTISQRWLCTFAICSHPSARLYTDHTGEGIPQKLEYPRRIEESFQAERHGERCGESPRDSHHVDVFDGKLCAARTRPCPESPWIISAVLPTPTEGRWSASQIPFCCLKRWSPLSIRSLQIPLRPSYLSSASGLLKRLSSSSSCSRRPNLLALIDSDLASAMTLGYPSYQQEHPATMSALYGGAGFTVYVGYLSLFPPLGSAECPISRDGSSHLTFPQHRCDSCPQGRRTESVRKDELCQVSDRPVGP